MHAVGGPGLVRGLMRSLCEGGICAPCIALGLVTPPQDVYSAADTMGVDWLLTVAGMVEVELSSNVSEGSMGQGCHCFVVGHPAEGATFHSSNV